MKNVMRLAAVGLMTIALAACGSRGGVTPSAGGAGSTDTSASSGASYGNATTMGTGASQGFTAADLDNPASPLAKRVVYFDFDRYDVQPAYQTLVAAHGAYLAGHPGAKVRIGGHCDERGTREYNLGLGERRANAVAELLLAAGARSSQIETVSYGEEQPVELCHAERCWSLNRRAEISYLSR